MRKAIRKSNTTVVKNVRDGTFATQHSLGKITSLPMGQHSNLYDEMATRMAGRFKRKKFSTKLDRDNPQLEKVYKEIIEYDPTNKVKAKNIKVTRQQIAKYLRHRYGPRQVDKIMQTFKFQLDGKFEDFCRTIEDFIAKETHVKRKFGFLMHDANQDGKICPIDVNIASIIFCRDFSYLHWFDLDLIRGVIQKQIGDIPEKQPGYHLEEFEKEFDEYWTAKKAGVKVKRKKLVIEDEVTERETGKKNPNLKEIFTKAVERKN